MSIHVLKGLRSVLVCVAVGLVAGCGGGGGGGAPVPPDTTLALMWDSLGRQVPEADFGRGDPDAAGLDGVAVDGGAPIYNGEVTLADNAGHTRTTVTGLDGYYRIDIKGLTPPFVVNVHRPGGRHWYSASAGPVRVRGFVTIHLSGLSDKALSLAADASGQGGVAAAVTPALLAANGNALAAAKATIRASLGVALINAGLDPAGYDPVSSPLRATAADRHALFLKGLAIRKNDEGRPDQGRTTVLGTLAGAGGSAQDGAAMAATFNQPAAVALDGIGNVYVADTGNNVIRKIAPDGVVTTFAGNGVANYANGVGASAAFNAPAGVAVDAAGNVYVADTGNYVIRKILPNGSVTTLAGAGVSGYLDATGTTAKFYGPRSVAVDNVGNVYVGDRPSYLVGAFAPELLRKVSPAGVVTTVSAQPRSGTAVTFSPRAIATGAGGSVYLPCSAGPLAGICSISPTGEQGMVTTPGNFINPSGLAVDAAGTGFMANGRAILRLMADGTLQTIAGGSFGNADGNGASAKFSDPGGIAIDGAGNIFVADTGNDTVRKVTPAADVNTVAGRRTDGFANGAAATATFAQPTAVAADAGGVLYIADTGNHAIRKLGPTGAVTTLAGSGAAGYADGAGSAASFSAPTGVAVDGSGNVYVADSGNHVIRKVTPAGSVSTLAGSGSAGYADGVGTAARFSRPAHIAVDGAGNVYVSDVGNVSIRKVTPAGVVSTIAGLGRPPDMLTERTAPFFDVGVLVADRSGAVTVDTTCQIRSMVLDLHCLFTIAPGGELGPARRGTRNEWDRTGLALDGAGNLYYAFLYSGKYGSEHQRKIFRLAPDGTETELASMPELTENAIAGMTFDAQGNLVFLDRNRSTVRILLP